LLICLSVGSLFIIIIRAEKLALCILIVFLVLLILFAVVEILVHTSGIKLLLCIVNQILELLWVLIIHIWNRSLSGGGGGVHLVWHEHLLLRSISIFGRLLSLRREVADIRILIWQSVSKLFSI
jgi:hypothetical protein